MVIDNEFDIGDIVYLKSDIEQKTRIVTVIRVVPVGLMYVLSCGINDSTHYGIEITCEKQV